MKITVRKLENRDVEPVSKIEEASFSMPWSPQAFADLVDDSQSLYLVAEVDGEVAGCCGVMNICGDGDIGNVVVAERFRNLGVGQRMMEELLVQGAEFGIRDFTLEVRVSNAPAIHVYEKLGFVSEGVRPGFYEKPREDALIMWRRLPSDQ